MDDHHRFVPAHLLQYLGGRKYLLLKLRVVEPETNQPTRIGNKLCARCRFFPGLHGIDQLSEAIHFAIGHRQQVSTGRLYPRTHYMSMRVNETGHHGFSLQIDLLGRFRYQWFTATNIANVNDFAALDRNGGSLGIVVIDGDDFTVEVDGIGSLRSGVVRRAATEQAGCNGQSSKI